MAATDPQDILGRVGDGSIGAGSTLIGAIMVALIGRKSPLAAIVNEQLRLLIQSQQEEIKSLRVELKAVKDDLRNVQRELDNARGAHGWEP